MYEGQSENIQTLLFLKKLNIFQKLFLSFLKISPNYV